MDPTVVLDVEPDCFLRSFAVSDADRLFGLVDAQRSFLRTWLPWLNTTMTASDARMVIETALQQHSANNGFQAGIWSHQRLIGVIGYHRVDWPNRSTSIGYWLGEEFQGRGIMTKACRAMISFAFDEYHLHRVEIRCAEQNLKSRAIPERLGFRPEGKIREAEWLYNHYVDHIVYGMLAPDWYVRELRNQSSIPGVVR